MSFDLETVQQHIPYYLTSEDKEFLVKELKAIASGGSADYILGEYYDSFESDMLQGDGWCGFQLFLFGSGEKQSVRGLVLSNSCDVDPTNSRDAPARVVFAPMVKLSAYIALLRGSSINPERANAKIAAIKAQKTTNIFFLPAGGPLVEDYIVRFDEVHSMPLALHAESSDRRKLFTLSNTGFYMLVLKLSIHFCRLQETVNRKPLASTAQRREAT